MPFLILVFLLLLLLFCIHFLALWIKNEIKTLRCIALLVVLLPASSFFSPTSYFACCSCLLLLSQTVRRQRQCCWPICRQLQKADKLQQNLPQCRPWQGPTHQMLQVSTTTTTTQLTTKSHNNSDSSETRPDQTRRERRHCVIFLSSAGPNFLAVAACVSTKKIQLLVGFGLQLLHCSPVVAREGAGLRKTGRERKLCQVLSSSRIEFQSGINECQSEWTRCKLGTGNGTGAPFSFSFKLMLNLCRDCALSSVFFNTVL